MRRKGYLEGLGGDLYMLYEYKQQNFCAKSPLNFIEIKAYNI